MYYFFVDMNACRMLESGDDDACSVVSDASDMSTIGAYFGSGQEKDSPWTGLNPAASAAISVSEARLAGLASKRAYVGDDNSSNITESSPRIMNSTQMSKTSQELTSGDKAADATGRTVFTFDRSQAQLKSKSSKQQLLPVPMPSISETDVDAHATGSQHRDEEIYDVRGTMSACSEISPNRKSTASGSCRENNEGHVGGFTGQDERNAFSGKIQATMTETTPFSLGSPPSAPTTLLRPDALHAPISPIIIYSEHHSSESFDRAVAKDDTTQYSAALSDPSIVHELDSIENGTTIDAPSPTAGGGYMLNFSLVRILKLL
jgi:hypothetical protein